MICKKLRGDTERTFQWWRPLLGICSAIQWHHTCHGTNSKKLKHNLNFRMTVKLNLAGNGPSQCNMTHALRFLLLLRRNETWRWHRLTQYFRGSLVLLCLTQSFRGSLVLLLLRTPLKDLLKSCFSQLSLLVLLHGLITFLSSKYCCSHLFRHILLVLPSLIKQSLIEIELQIFLVLIANTLVMVDNLLPVAFCAAILSTWKTQIVTVLWRPHKNLHMGLEASTFRWYDATSVTKLTHRLASVWRENSSSVCVLFLLCKLLLLVGLLGLQWNLKAAKGDCSSQHGLQLTFAAIVEFVSHSEQNMHMWRPRAWHSLTTQPSSSAELSSLSRSSCLRWDASNSWHWNVFQKVTETQFADVKMWLKQF